MDLVPAIYALIMLPAVGAYLITYGVYAYIVIVTSKGDDKDT